MLKSFQCNTTKGVANRLPLTPTSGRAKFTQTKAWAANNKDRWRRNILSFWTSTARHVLHTHWRCYSHSSQAAHCHLQFVEQAVFTPFHLKSVILGNSLRKVLCTKQQDGCESCQPELNAEEKRQQQNREDPAAFHTRDMANDQHKQKI